MSASSPASDAPAVPADALRLVLFGLPNAGKSSLLGALGQARTVIAYGGDGKESGRSYFDTRGRPMKLATPPGRPGK